MRGIKNQIALKKENKTIYTNTINSAININFREFHKDGKPEIRGIENYEVEEKLKYPKRYQIKSESGRELYYKEDKNDEPHQLNTQYNLYQRNIQKGIGYRLAEDKITKNNHLVSEISDFKKSFDREKKFNQSSRLTLNDYSNSNINDKYFKANENEIINDFNRNNERNLKSSQSRKETKYNSYNINDLRNTQKQKLYMNNNRNGNRIMYVAQKICNILIKGKKRKNKKNKKNKKKEKIMKENIEKISINNKKDLENTIKNESNIYNSDENMEKEEVFKIIHNEKENYEHFDKDYDKIQNENEYENEENKYNSKHEEEVYNIEHEAQHEEEQDEYDDYGGEDVNNEVGENTNKINKTEYEKTKIINIEKINNETTQINYKDKKTSNRQPITQIQKIDQSELGRIIRMNNIKKIHNKKDLQKEKLNNSNDVIKKSKNIIKFLQPDEKLKNQNAINNPNEEKAQLNNKIQLHKVSFKRRNNSNDANGHSKDLINKIEINKVSNNQNSITKSGLNNRYNSQKNDNLENIPRTPNNYKVIKIDENKKNEKRKIPIYNNNRNSTNNQNENRKVLANNTSTFIDNNNNRLNISLKKEQTSQEKSTMKHKKVYTTHTYTSSIREPLNDLKNNSNLNLSSQEQNKLESNNRRKTPNSLNKSTNEKSMQKEFIPKIINSRKKHAISFISSKDKSVSKDEKEQNDMKQSTTNNNNEEENINTNNINDKKENNKNNQSSNLSTDKKDLNKNHPKETNIDKNINNSVKIEYSQGRRHIIANSQNLKSDTPNSLKTMSKIKDNKNLENSNNTKPEETNGHKSNSITIVPKEGPKVLGRSYISSVSKKNQRTQSTGKSDYNSKKANEVDENVNQMNISTPIVNKKNNDININNDITNSNSNNVNRIFINSNIREKKDNINTDIIKDENKNEIRKSSKYKNEIIYSSNLIPNNKETKQENINNKENKETKEVKPLKENYNNVNTIFLSSSHISEIKEEKKNKNQDALLVHKTQVYKTVRKKKEPKNPEISNKDKEEKNSSDNENKNKNENIDIKSQEISNNNEKKMENIEDKKENILNDSNIGNNIEEINHEEANNETEAKKEIQVEGNKELKLEDELKVNNTENLSSSKNEIKTENPIDKYNFLNFNMSNYLNTLNLNLNTEDKFSLINKSDLSDYTKAYMNSIASATRPELSDYTKAYLDSVSLGTSDVKPELSNLTKEYLSSNYDG